MFVEKMRQLGQGTRRFFYKIRIPNWLGYILVGIVALAFIAGCIWLSGWLLMFLWNLALVGIFPSIPILDIWKAIGLIFFLSFVGTFFKK